MKSENQRILSSFAGFHPFCANALTAVKGRTTPHLSYRCHTHRCSDSTESDTLWMTNSCQKLPHSQRQRKFTTGADKSWGRAPEAASNVHNSHEKRREKAKMRGILSVNTTVPQLVHAPVYHLIRWNVRFCLDTQKRIQCSCRYY